MEQAQKKEEQPLKEGSSKKKVNIFRRGFVWRPVPTIVSTTLCFLISGIIFVVIGIIILYYSSKIKEFEIRYDNLPDCDQALDDPVNKTCAIQINITEYFKEPVMVYYQLENFFQNHRRYIKSKSLKQLKGETLTVKDIKDDCDPIIRNSDLWQKKSIDGIDLNPDDPAHPCGLIARSLFNDSYKLQTEEGVDIQIYSDGIAWKSDKKRYKNAKNANITQWTNIEDERFMVWMRPAGLSDFRKLWGKIRVDLEPGIYSLNITNNYQVRSFNGKKSFVLSTVTGLGGKNNFLGVTYIVVGGISIIMAILFWIGYKKFNSDKKIKIN